MNNVVKRMILYWTHKLLIRLYPELASYLDGMQNKTYEYCASEKQYHEDWLKIESALTSLFENNNLIVYKKRNKGICYFISDYDLNAHLQIYFDDVNINYTVSESIKDEWKERGIFQSIYPAIHKCIKILMIKDKAFPRYSPLRSQEAYYWRFHRAFQFIFAHKKILMLTKADENYNFYIKDKDTNAHFRILYHDEYIIEEEVHGEWIKQDMYKHVNPVIYRCAGLILLREKQTKLLSSSQPRQEEARHVGRARIIDMAEQWRSERHRSGWGYAIDGLRTLHRDNMIKLDSFVEDNFIWRRERTQAYKQPWIGFIHNPHNIPDYPCYDRQRNQWLFQSAKWNESLLHCRGIFCLSKYHQRYLEKVLNVKVEALVHPTETPAVQFDFEKFQNNPNKKIIQIGSWLRNPNSIYKLHATMLQKARLDSGVPWENKVRQCMPAEDLDTASVDVIPFQDNDAYDDLLSQNIVFLDLFDASANNVVVECIVRNTPLLVNRHPAVEEYLGSNYPLFFHSLDDASKKAADLPRIRQAYEYLKHLSKAQFSQEYFFNSFVNSSIIQELDVPKKNILIFTEPRSGSTALAKIINTHPYIQVSFEPFHPSRETWTTPSIPYYKQVYDISSLDKTLNQIHVSYNAIKHLTYQLDNFSVSFTEHLLKSGYCLIFLVRKNILRALVSEFISQQLHSFTSSTNIIVNQELSPIDLALFSDNFEARIDRITRYKKFLEDHHIPHLEIDYEDIFDLRLSEDEKLKQIDCIFDYIGVQSPTGSALEQIKAYLNPAMHKLNTSETYNKIPNIMKIEERFGSHEWGYLFKD